MLAFVAFLGVILVGSGSCWHFDGDCNVKCFGLDCILGKPTNAEVCELGKNFGVFRSKCCGAEPNSEVGTLNLFGKIARDINQFQEQLQMRFEPGWYFNQSCSMSCRLFSCFFKPKPSKAELCQTTMNKNHECCATNGKTAQATTNGKTAKATTNHLSENIQGHEDQ